MPSPQTLLASHRALLLNMLADNAACPADRVTRLVLNQMDRKARRWLRRIEHASKSPAEGFTGSTLGLWGENGHAPSIRDLVRQAALHRGKIIETKIRMEEAA